MKNLISGKLLLFLLVFFLALPQLPAQAVSLVYVLPLEGVIDGGLVGFLQRGYREAEAAGATWMLLEVDTPGGLVEAALEISRTIQRSTVPTAVFVRGGAISAGALVALSAKKLIMAPGTTMGAAEPRVGEKKADEKTVSFWAGQLAAAAEAHGRNPGVARAMADADVGIPGVVGKGKLLTLTDAQAIQLGMADAVLENRQQALDFLGVSGAPVAELKIGLAEKVARWATSPFLGPLFLTIGLAGLLIEVFTVGFGVAGVIGIIFLSLYFGGSMLAGLTGWEGILLFLLGVILLALEALVIPGFGVTGVAGAVALVASVFLVSASTQVAVASLVLAILGSLALLAISIKFLPARKSWQRLVLNLNQDKAGGYIAPQPALEGFVGMEATALTPLRPAGTARLADGSRLDVISEGDFIPAGNRVRVVKVEGVRVVVRPEVRPAGKGEENC